MCIMSIVIVEDEWSSMSTISGKRHSHLNALIPSAKAWRNMPVNIFMSPAQNHPSGSPLYFAPPPAPPAPCFGGSGAIWLTTKNPIPSNGNQYFCKKDFSTTGSAGLPVVASTGGAGFKLILHYQPYTLPSQGFPRSTNDPT